MRRAQRRTQDRTIQHGLERVPLGGSGVVLGAGCVPSWVALPACESAITCSNAWLHRPCLFKHPRHASAPKRTCICICAHAPGHCALPPVRAWYTNPRLRVHGI
eukprot:350388-Chlamydomonas_euryale.AAC.3